MKYISLVLSENIKLLWILNISLMSIAFPLLTKGQTQALSADISFSADFATDSLLVNRYVAQARSILDSTTASKSNEYGHIRPKERYKIIGLITQKCETSLMNKYPFLNKYPLSYCISITLYSSENEIPKKTVVYIKDLHTLYSVSSIRETMRMTLPYLLKNG